MARVISLQLAVRRRAVRYAQLAQDAWQAGRLVDMGIYVAMYRHYARMEQQMGRMRNAG